MSNSRNVGLKAIQADWVVLCDDDVTLLMDGLDALRQHLQRVPGNVGAVATQLMKGPDSPWRNYDPTLQVIQGRAWSAKLAIQRINSMELVLNRAHMRDGGWGSTLVWPWRPTHHRGEEVLVLSNMLNRGWAVQVLPVATRVHPDESSGSMGNRHRVQPGPCIDSPLTRLSGGCCSLGLWPNDSFRVPLRLRCTLTCAAGGGPPATAESPARWAILRGHTNLRSQTTQAPVGSPPRPVDSLT